MGAAPTTRPSLLLRLRDRSDHEAWNEFVALYGALVYRFARSRGLQDADASDVSQIVFHEVSLKIQRLDYDPRHGLFRNWLLVVTRNQISKYVAKMQGGVARVTQPLCHGAIEGFSAEAQDCAQWEREYRLRAFGLAAQRVRQEVEESSWQAFWRTAVKGEPAKVVSASLGMSIGAIYTARSRVLGRVKAAIARFDDADIPFLEN